MNLALKYRPQDFEALVGQEKIISALNAYLDLSKAKGHLLHQVFLFAGERGTGKTTSARILSKSLNCRQGPTSKPCGVCDTCTSQVLDIVEWNAADTSSISDVRELKSKIKISPSLGKYKVYILDEIHLFSPQAFDALLKMLEEPPKHAVFILATTELNAIPETIKSRVQIYKFNLIPQEIIVARLQKVCQLEGISIGLEGLNYIAKAGRGSMRDSLTILMRVCNSLEIPIKDEEVLSILGYCKKEILQEILNATLKKDGKRILEIMAELDSTGIDYMLFWQDLIQELRENIEIIFFKENLSQRSRILERLVEKTWNVQNSSNPRVEIELILLTME